MAKSTSDRTTQDLFADDRRPGRPRTNPLPRDEQIRINKRNQVKRDKAKGLRRIECKVSPEIYDALQRVADAKQISRSTLIGQILSDQLMSELHSSEGNNELWPLEKSLFDD